MGYWGWVALWFSIAFVGNEPIHTAPIQVTEATSANYESLGDYGQ